VLHVLIQTLALAHPLIPFVTEEIYSYVPATTSLLAAGVPEAERFAADSQAEEAVGRLIEAVQALRGWRDHAGVRAGVHVSARLAATGYEETASQVARLARVDLSADGGDPVASVPVPGGAVEILASEAVDVEALERKRAGERARLGKEIALAERKLANQGFVSKAPSAVVEAERDKLERLRADLEAL
jgi:valyl-tRNA synthetase